MDICLEKEGGRCAFVRLVLRPHLGFTCSYCIKYREGVTCETLMGVQHDWTKRSESSYQL